MHARAQPRLHPINGILENEAVFRRWCPESLLRRKEQIWRGFTILDAFIITADDVIE